MAPDPNPGRAKAEFISGFQPDTIITSSFLVVRKDLRQKQNGEPYLSLTLGDRTGQIEANLWDRVNESQLECERDGFVKVKAAVALYRDKLQLKIEKMRRLDESEVELGDFLPATTADVAAMWTELHARVEAFQNLHLRTLLLAILDDPDIAARYRKAPAAKALHHARLGGLLEHVTSLCRLAEFMGRHYPFLDSDLLFSGIVLHDLGKIGELSYARSFAYTSEGQLLGHIVMALEIIHCKLAAFPNFPRPLQVLLEHLIISHHGKYEFGSPKLPMFPEAMMLHQLDDMDSKMEAMRAQLEVEAGLEGDFTTYNRSLDRPLLRVEAFLSSPHPEAESEAGAATDPTDPPNLILQAERLRAALRGGAG